MRSLFIRLLLASLALSARAAFGQSLSLARSGENDFQIEAVVPSDTRYVLQASGDLAGWTDLRDDVLGRFSCRVAGAGAGKRFFRLVLWTPPPGPIRIVLVGDSTASDVNGWGLGMPAYLASNAQFVNYAIPGTSTRLFLRSDEMNNMILLRPDVVLVQLGMMDTAEDQTIGTSLADYADNLRTIVRTVRGFEGTPILLTTHAARYWDGAGKVLPTWQDRNAVVKAVAAELGTDLIDLYQSTLELYSELGKDGSRYMESIYFPGEAMHFSPEGARVIAGLVARSFPSSLRPYVVLTGTDPQPP